MVKKLIAFVAIIVIFCSVSIDVYANNSSVPMEGSTIINSETSSVDSEQADDDAYNQVQEDESKSVTTALSENMIPATASVQYNNTAGSPKGRSLVAAIIDACLMIAGVIAAIICWRKGLNR